MQIFSKSAGRFLFLPLALILLNTPESRAQQGACINDEQGTHYYFVNGVFTDFVSAALSTQRLIRELNEEEILQPSDRVSLAYNSTQFYIFDLIEALAQDIQTDIGPTFNELGETAYEIAVRVVIASGTVIDLPFLDGQKIENQVADLLIQFTEDLVGNDEVDEHVARYRSNLLVGEKVVLVAHSQGNFFANLSLLEMTDEEQASVGIVSIANPDSQVGSNQCREVDPGTVSAFEVSACSTLGTESTWLLCDGAVPQYTTVCRDKVIRGLRVLYDIDPGPSTTTKALPPNFLGPGGLEEDDWFWHGFEDIYLSEPSTTQSRILRRILETDSSLISPDLVGDLSIRGAVLSGENLALIGGARVKVELIAQALADQFGDEDLYDGVVDDYTNQEGAYELCVPSSALPQNILISASKDGYIPQIVNFTNPGAGDVSLDFQLAELNMNTVIIEIDPVIHHLGDDSASGSINSQFQKLSEGLVYETTFFLDEEQRQAQTATLELSARGLQAENPLSINSEIVAFLNSSPADGSFGTISIPIPIATLDVESGVQQLRIESVSGGIFSDFDDFEFVNILITLTF